MGDMIIRDPDSMDAFANEMDEYVESVKSACMKLRSSIDSSSTLMRDEKSSEAISRVNEFIDAILSDLPNATDLADTLRKAAEPLKEARGLKF